MNALILTALLFVQGIPVAASQTGTISGVLKDSAGKPAAGIRVAAGLRPDSFEALAGDISAFTSLAETDDAGRFKLESVPPGKYLVSAGALNSPTYYPGTQAIVEAKVIAVAPAETVVGIDFTLNASSAGRLIGSNSNSLNLQTNPPLPVGIFAEGGAKVPIFGNGKQTGVRLVPVSGGTPITATVQAPNLAVPPVPAEYRLTVEGLPEGYSVKSIKYGSAEITDGILRIANPTSASQNQSGLLNYVIVATGNIPVGNITTSTAFSLPAGIPVFQSLTVLLSREPTPGAASGVTVSGQLSTSINGAFLTGKSATIYADRTYELRNVPPGRHTFAAFGGSRTTLLAASVVIGDRDVSDIELEEVEALPLNTRTATVPGPVGGRAPGKLPLASVHGKIVDGETGELITRGDIYIVGDYFKGRELKDDGKFQFDKLLPGKYMLEVRAVGYVTFQREFTIDEQDIDLEVKSN